MKAIVLMLSLALLPVTGLRAEDAAPEKPRIAGVEHTLKDGDSTAVVIKGWTFAKKEEKNLIGWCSSDEGKTHTHRIYRLAKDELLGKTGQDHAQAIYKTLTEGDEILFETEWKTALSQGGKAARKTAHLKSDVSGDDAKEDLWVIVESKEFEDRVYLQVVFQESPLDQAKLDLIDKVLNSVQPKATEAKAAP